MIYKEFINDFIYTDDERYELYCKYNGLLPDDMIEFDNQRWHGYPIVGYILWIDKHLQDYIELNPSCFILPDEVYNQEGFLDYLRDVVRVHLKENETTSYVCPYCHYIVDKVYTDTTDENVCNKMLELENRIVEMEKKQYEEKKRNQFEELRKDLYMTMKRKIGDQ